jgi:putative hemolysin
MRTLSFDNALVRDLPGDPQRGTSRRQMHGALYSRVALSVIRSPCALIVLGASAICIGPAHAQGPSGGAGLANPASQNCVRKGGNLVYRFIKTSTY